MRTHALTRPMYLFTRSLRACLLRAAAIWSSTTPRTWIRTTSKSQELYALPPPPPPPFFCLLHHPIGFCMRCYHSVSPSNFYNQPFPPFRFCLVSVCGSVVTSTALAKPFRAWEQAPLYPDAPCIIFFYQYGHTYPHTRAYMFAGRDWGVQGGGHCHGNRRLFPPGRPGNPVPVLHKGVGFPRMCVCVRVCVRVCVHMSACARTLMWVC